MSKQRTVGRGKRLMVPMVVVGTVAAGAVGFGASPAFAATTAGYACAYTTDISLGGTPQGTEGCGTQTSSDASSNSAAPSINWTGTAAQTVDSGGAKASFGPAVFLSSPYDTNDALINTGELKVSTSGASNPTMDAKSSGLGPSPFWTATSISATHTATPDGYVEAQCLATSTTQSGMTNVVDGYVDTSLDSNGYPTNTVAVPTNALNGLTSPYTVDFTIDNIVTGGVVEHGTMVFNEQTTNATDKSIVINGAHMVADGPFAVGDQIISQVKCSHA